MPSCAALLRTQHRRRLRQASCAAGVGLGLGAQHSAQPRHLPGPRWRRRCAELIDGKAIAETIRGELKAEVEQLKEKYGKVRPGG